MAQAALARQTEEEARVDEEYEFNEILNGRVDSHSYSRPRASREELLREGYALTDDEYECGLGDLMLYGDI